MSTSISGKKRYEKFDFENMVELPQWQDELVDFDLRYMIDSEKLFGKRYSQTLD